MKRKKLIFIGGGDLHREILWTANTISPAERDWEPFGIIDDKPDEIRSRLTKFGSALRLVGSIADHQPSSEEVYIPAIGSPKSKLHVTGIIENRGGVFVNIIHPTAIIAPDAALGTGIFIFMNAVISVGAVIENFVTINMGAMVGHDATIGRGSTLSPAVAVTGHARLGKGVFMGTQAGIVPNTTAHDFSVIGAGSMAMQEVPAGSTVLGVPARPCTPGKPRPT